MIHVKIGQIALNGAKTVVEETKQKTGRDSDQFILRFPEGMRQRISKLAEASGRSMNAEIIARLKASFENEGRVDEISEQLKILKRRMDKFQENQHSKKRS
jgi:polyhydroxyalkanoate synthesis regulator phasin